MNLKDILSGQKFNNLEKKIFGVSTAIGVDPDDLVDVLATLLKTKNFRYETIVARDTTTDIEVTYILHQHIPGQELDRVAIRVLIDRYSPKLKTVKHLWAAAQFDEFEIKELLGVEVLGLGSQQSTFLPEGWIGYPLKKDYVFPENFDGIEHRRLPLRKEHNRP